MKHIILKESQAHLLLESAQDFEYHFTSFQRAIAMAEASYTIHLSSTLAKQAEMGYGKGKMFYLSMTRARDGRLGYSRSYPVRIVLDGQKLNQNYKIIPVQYWAGDVFDNKYKYYQYLKNDPEKSFEVSNFKKENPNASQEELQDFISKNFNTSAQRHISNESEDRLLSREPFLDLSKYMVSIDVLFDPASSEQVAAAATIYRLYGNRTRLYDNEKDFNSFNGKTVNEEFGWNKKYDAGAEAKQDRRFSKEQNITPQLGYIFKWILLDWDKKDAARGIKEYLNKYGLQRFIKHISLILDKVRYISSDDIYNVQDALRKLSDNPTRDGHNALKMFSDWFQSHGFKTYKDLDNYKEEVWSQQRGGNSEIWNIIDTDAPVEYMTAYGLMVPHPEITDIWKYIEAYNGGWSKVKEDVINDIFSYVRDYNIPVRNNEDSFYKYLQHLTHKCTFSELYQVLQRLGINSEELSSVPTLAFESKSYFQSPYRTIDQLLGAPYEKQKKDIEQYYLENAPKIK